MSSNGLDTEITGLEEDREVKRRYARDEVEKKDASEGKENGDRDGDAREEGGIGAG